MIALHAPERLQKLVLCSTGAKIGTADAWNNRIEAVRRNGTKSIAAATMERWFTTGFRDASHKQSSAFKTPCQHQQRRLHSMLRSPARHRLPRSSCVAEITKV